jgi:hypothetical protein
MKNLFGFLKMVNPWRLMKLVQKYGDHAKLIADTAAFYFEQGQARGILQPDQLVTPVQPAEIKE